MKRAERRAHIARLKKKRQKYWWQDEPVSGKWLGIAVSAPKSCNCWQCQNPRRALKELTIQERRRGSLPIIIREPDQPEIHKI